VILVARGNAPSATRPEDPGSVHVYGYAEDRLSELESIAPNGGFNFQARHLDFHPTRPWAYLTLERQNKLEVYLRLEDGTLDPHPLFIKDTVRTTLPGQITSTVHIHPNGKFVYVGNRRATGPENSIGVFAIDQNSGEPTLIQSVDTRGISPRTFALDPRGRLLVAANQLPQTSGDPGETTVPMSLAVFRIRRDGELEFVRKYDVSTEGRRVDPTGGLFWVGIVPF
jgi:hypothetical protein